MKNRPLGCLTLNGLIAAALMLLFTGGMGLARGGALFSPGALSQYSRHEIGGAASHSEIRACSACHASPWSPEHMKGRCLACHTNVQEQLESGEGMHVILIGTGSSDCLACHTEHNGPNASLTHVDKDTFPHDSTGFSLKAHHDLPEMPLRCEDCHANLDQFDPIVCEECHAKIDLEFTASHNLSFGKDCLNCHDGLDTYGKAFDHSAAPFKLTGKHQQAACTDCHQNQTTLEAVRATPQDCAGCHAKDDSHAGAFGDQCQICHTPEGWEDALFDHSSTGFPLTGKHIPLKCSDCHAVDNFSEISKSCSSCHAEDDAHAGAFGTNCEQCHVPDGWDTIIFDHDTTGFALTGKHISVKCMDCHQSGLSGTPETCYGCHAADDAHSGGFGTDCGRCHVTDDWSKVTFDHEETGFPLNGGHSGLECRRCHQNGFSNTPTACSACHAEPAYHAGMFGSDCGSCHNISAWAPAGYNGPHTFPINHGDAGRCSDCHPSSLSGYTCFSCHNQAEMVGEHSKEGISNIGNCTGCHPTGEGGDGEGGGGGGGEGEDDD
jgi:hypothetical protein